MLIPRHISDISVNDIMKAAISLCSVNNTDILLRELFGEKEFVYLENARAGIYLTLAHLPPGEVILPAFICQFVPHMVISAGHRPIFIDIGKDQLTFMIDQVKEAISTKTRAIIAAHLFGIPWDLRELVALTRSKGIILIEDAAAAFGSKYAGQFVGTMGDVAVFSFGKGKALPIGRGGLLVINNSMMKDNIFSSIKSMGKGNCFYAAIFLLANNIIYKPMVYSLAYSVQQRIKGGDFWEKGEIGESDKCAFKLMDALIKKVLERQLSDWRKQFLRRQEIAFKYKNNISNPLLHHFTINEDMEPSWPCYPLRVENREKLFKYMHDNKIDLSWSWSYNIAAVYGQKGCQNATYLSESILSLPLYPSLPDEIVDQIISLANQYAA